MISSLFTATLNLTFGKYYWLALKNTKGARESGGKHIIVDTVYLPDISDV